MCYAGFWLEVAKRNVTAATKAVLEDGAALVLCGVAAGGCKMHCAGCDENKWAAEATEEVADRGRHLRAEAGQRRSRPDKRQLREEAAERRGASAKRSPSEEVKLNKDK